MSALSAVALGALLAASHDGRINGDTIEWTTTFISSGEGVERLELAAPLAREVELELPAGSSAILDAAGDVVALHVPPGSWSRGAGDRLVLSMRARQRAGRDAAVSIAPLVAASAVQRLTLVAAGDAVRFVPDATLGIEQHLTHAVSRGVTASRRDQCDAFLGGTGSTSPAIWTAYLIADGPLAERGLFGTIHTGRPSRRAALAVGAGFAAVVAALLALHRLLDRRAREEHDEALLRSEVERMRAAARLQS